VTSNGGSTARGSVGMAMKAPGLGKALTGVLPLPGAPVNTARALDEALRASTRLVMAVVARRQQQRATARWL
jgi:hypothetical protein